MKLINLCNNIFTYKNLFIYEYSVRNLRLKLFKYTFCIFIDSRQND